MTGWLIIFAGLLFTGFSLYKKNQIYSNFVSDTGPQKPEVISENRTGKEKKDNDNQDQVYKQQQNQEVNKEEFNKICRRLDQIINHLSSNKQKFTSELEEIKENFSDSDPEFKQILNQKYREDLQENISEKEEEKNKQIEQGKPKEAENKTIPEKYDRVLKMVQEGKNSRQIAEELELGFRETQMILKLYSREADKNVQQI
ncbi:MAG: DUF6115 domain-containing protein [Halanaerobiaceae bacterium]